MRHVLAVGRIHGSETDIISPVLFGLEGFLQIMGGLADDPARPEQFAGSADTAVILPQVDTVGLQLKRQLHVIIDDKSNAEAPAELLQLPTLIQTELAPLILGTILKDRNAATQRPPHPADQIIPLIGDQVDAGDRQLLGSRIIYHESDWSLSSAHDHPAHKRKKPH